jgi:hypothetical protein
MPIHQWIEKYNLFRGKITFAKMNNTTSNHAIPSIQYDQEALDEIVIEFREDIQGKLYSYLNEIKQLNF